MINHRTIAGRFILAFLFCAFSAGCGGANRTEAPTQPSSTPTASNTAGCGGEPCYEATARFMRRSVSLPGQEEPISTKLYERMRTMMIYNFKGRPAVQQLIADLNLTRGLPHSDGGELTSDGKVAYEAMVGLLQSAITIDKMIETPEMELIAVSVRHKDKDQAPKIANQLVENYLRKVRQEMDDSMLETKKFFDTEVNRYRRKVGELEQARLRFLIGSGGIEPSDPIQVHNKLTDLRLKRETLRAATERTKGSILELSMWEKDQPEFIDARPETNPEIALIKERLMTLHQTYVTLIAEDGVAPDHAAAKRILARIKEAEASLAKAGGVAVDGGADGAKRVQVPNIQKLEAQKELRQKAAELKAVEKDLEQVEADAERYDVLNRNFFVVRNDFLKITRELDDARDQLKFWDDQLRKVQLALTFAVSDRGMRLSVVERAGEAKLVK